jgi:hypothetical protein
MPILKGEVGAESRNRILFGPPSIGDPESPLKSPVSPWGKDLGVSGGSGRYQGLPMGAYGQYVRGLTTPIITQAPCRSSCYLRSAKGVPREATGGLQDRGVVQGNRGRKTAAGSFAFR